MMKGSTGGQGGGSYGQQFNKSAMNSTFGPINAFMMAVSPQYAQKFGGAGTGSKGTSQPQEQRMSLPSVPEYTNYQQMPVYSSQPAAPSDAITRFMSGYASGGSVEPDVNASLEEDIKAALRLARLIGQMTKKE
jgi:hypothetical protein